MPLISIVSPFNAISDSMACPMKPAYNPDVVSRIRTALLAALASLAAGNAALATPCWFEAQGEGRVAAVIDARSFRLADGRGIRAGSARCGKAQRGAVGDYRRPRRHAARRRRCARPLRAPDCVCLR